MTKAYFNGAITQNQIICVILSIVAVILILLFVKKIVKVVLTVGVIISALVYFGVASPEQIGDVAAIVSDKGQKAFTQISETSNNVKFDNSNGLDIQVRINDKWINVNDIKSFVKSKNGVYTVTVDGKSYSVSDDSIKQVLDLLEKQ